MNKPVAVGLGVVALAAAAYVGGTAYVGQRLQTELEAQPAKLQQQLPFIKIAGQSYDKGLFSSTRTVTLQFGCEPAAADGQANEGEAARKPLLLTVRDHISHGPLAGGKLGAAVIDTELELPPETREALAKLFGEQKPFAARTVVGFGGEYTSDVSSPALQVTGQQGEQLSWKGVTGTVRSDAAGTFMNYQFSAPGIEVNDPGKGGKLVVSGLRFQGEGRPVSAGSFLMVGKDEGEIASIEFSGQPPVQQAAAAGEPLKFSLANLKFNSDTSVEQELLNSKLSLTGTGMIGSTKLDKLELEGSLKRLHAPSYQRMMAKMMKASFSCEAKADEADPQAMLAAMQEDLIALLPHNPEYALDKLAVEYGGKRGELSYSVGVQGVSEADLKTPPMALMMTKGQVKADIKLPVSWIEQIAGKAPVQGAAAQPEMVGMMLDQFAAQGYIVRDGDFVGASLRFEKGALSLNGKPLPVGLPPAAAAQ
ncbi:YdgA family protein [Aquabacterium sp. A7-Y]|uniref:YdgA family protein n=1 Tax=Aquabacterium sp. A7-Y TaxID=1349605 RepID=UPI00223D27B1|nr:YdgA family protein [Aquabacterium sp. A7-Y]MCW7539304.1 YdgA family protein [Aquabacterium sp. A7-Y]